MQLISFLKKILKTLNNLQKKLIAHRDIKPSNFLLSSDYKSFKLNDFSEAI